MNKEVLRKTYKEIRANIQNKAIRDQDIFIKVTELAEYRHAKLVLAYVSQKEEVDSLEFIKYSLKIGKQVAVPKCVGKHMVFYYIRSLEDLEVGRFGIMEPVISEAVTDFGESICIVPGIAFDKNGHRVGYGAGFYDRFLGNYTGTKIGLTYQECICEAIDVNPYDVKMDMVLCEMKC